MIQLLKNDTKVFGGGSLNLGRFSVTGSSERSLNDGSTNTSFGIESAMGSGPKLKFEGGAVNSTTIFFRTEEFDLKGN